MRPVWLCFAEQNTADGARNGQIAIDLTNETLNGMQIVYCEAVMVLAAIALSGCGQSAATEPANSGQTASDPARNNVSEAAPSADPPTATESPVATEPPISSAAAPAAPADVPKPKAAPADRAPTKPGDAEKITFD